MTNIIFVLGSTIADATSQANGAFAKTDYISDLTVEIEQANAQTTGSSILVGFVKNNGHFAGFRGHRNCTVIGSFGASASVLTTNVAAKSANSAIYDLNVGILGSDSTGSNVYFAIALETTDQLS